MTTHTKQFLANVVMAFLLGLFAISVIVGLLTDPGWLIHELFTGGN